MALQVDHHVHHYQHDVPYPGVCQPSDSAACYRLAITHVPLDGHLSCQLSPVLPAHPCCVWRASQWCTPQQPDTLLDTFHVSSMLEYGGSREGRSSAAQWVSVGTVLGCSVTGSTRPDVGKFVRLGIDNSVDSFEGYFYAGLMSTTLIACDNFTHRAASVCTYI